MKQQGYSLAFRAAAEAAGLTPDAFAVAMRGLLGRVKIRCARQCCNTTETIFTSAVLEAARGSCGRAVSQHYVKEVQA